MEGDRTEADDESPAVRQEPFLLHEQLLVIREHERRVRGQAGHADVFASFLQQDERGPEAIEGFRDGRDRSVDSRGGFALHPGDIHEGAPDQGGIGTDVRLVGLQPKADQSHETGRSRWSEEQQADLNVSAEVVGQQERGVRGIEQDVHPASSSGEVVERKPRVRGGPMSDHEEAAHGRSNVLASLRIRRNLGTFIYLSG